jgi:hypothetical protein
MHLSKIISGGQTGVDRGALDAALSIGFLCGGWCPQDRKAEDGPIPDRYPLVVLPGAGYRQRTLKNVKDSDATVIIYANTLSGGTKLTQDFCQREKKPFVVVDARAQRRRTAGERMGRGARVHSRSCVRIDWPAGCGGCWDRIGQ